jgi:hypothetical protein
VGEPRTRALVGAIVSLVAGAASRVWPLGAWVWDKSVGDVAYATLLGFLVALAWPRARPWVVGVVAAASCFAIELFQLTGIPKRLPRLLHVALGDTFAWHDVVCYGVGAAVVVLVLGARRTAA